MKSENPVLEKWIDRGKRGVSGSSEAKWRKKLTDGADPPDQVAALAALQSINKLSYSDLERVLESPHWLVRWSAIESLNSVCDKREVKLIISALKDKSYVHRAAAEALVKIGDPAVDPLITALKDGNSDVRQAAAEALGKIGDPRAVEPLITALKDDEYDVRKAANEAIEKIGLPNDLKIQISFLIARKEWSKLVNIGAPAVEPLITALKDDEYDVRKAAAESLGKIGDPRAVDPLITALKDTSPDVREAAAESLGNIGGPRAVDPLITALKDDDSDVGKAAAEALDKIGDPSAIEPLKWAYKDLPQKKEAIEIIKSIIKKNKNSIPREDGLICPDCYCRFIKFKIFMLMKINRSYIACNECRGDSAIKNIEKIIAVMDKDMEEIHLIQDSRILVNWFKFGKPFDYDEIWVRNADNFDVGNFFLEYHKDHSDYRIKRRKEIPVFISPSLELPAGSVNLFKFNFKSVEVVDI